MGKEDGLHVYSEILLSHKKEWNNAIYNNNNNILEITKNDKEFRSPLGRQFLKI